MIARGDRLGHAVLPVAGGDMRSLLRITYRWNCAAGTGTLWAEQPGRNVPPCHVDVDAAPPLPAMPLLLAAGARVHCASRLLAIAASTCRSSSSAVSGGWLVSGVPMWRGVGSAAHDPTRTDLLSQTANATAWRHAP